MIVTNDTANQNLCFVSHPGQVERIDLVAILFMVEEHAVQIAMQRVEFSCTPAVLRLVVNLLFQERHPHAEVLS